MSRGNAGAGVLLLACVWIGIVIGVSFIATIAKFDAPSLTLPVALDVGRHTFTPLARIEWGLGLLLLLAAGRAGWDRACIAAIGTIAVILAVQALWLLPALDARVELILAGTTPPPSQLHLLFIAAEAAKILALAALAFAELRRLTAAAAG